MSTTPFRCPHLTVCGHALYRKKLILTSILSISLRTRTCVSMSATTEFAKHLGRLREFACEIAGYYIKNVSKTAPEVELVFEHLKHVDYECCVYLTLNGSMSRLAGSILKRGALTILEALGVDDEKVGWVSDCMAEYLCDEYGHSINWKT